MSTPALALTYEILFASTCAHFLDPLHALATQLLIFVHWVALVAYEGMHDEWHRDAPVRVGSASWLEVSALATFGLMFLTSVGYVYGVQMERMRRSDTQLRARALALHVSTERIVRNFLPAAVLNAVNKREVDGVNMDIVAWSFDPACLLQSDIVGFTALGSRISPEDLCGCDLTFPFRPFHLFCMSTIFCFFYHRRSLVSSLQVSARPLLAV